MWGWDNVFSWVSTVSSCLGILTAIISLSTWFMVLSERRNTKKHRKRIEDCCGNNPAIFVVNLLPEDIFSRITLFIRGNKELSEIPSNMIVRYEWGKEEEISHNDIDSIISGIRKKYAELRMKGYDRVHFFYGGPSSIAAIIGSIISNSGFIIPYQYNKVTKQYEVWGMLDPKRR